MDGDFSDLVIQLQSVHRDNLVSVVAYGSAIEAPGNPKKTDYELLIMTKHLRAEDLRRSRPVVQEWVLSGHNMPVFFTADEFKHSLDVYPIEFTQMKRAYRVLHGLDPLAGVEISKANLRWETEHELRGKLLRLRSLYLPASLSSADLTHLMTDSIVSFVKFMRPVLTLLGEDPPLGRLATIQRIGEKLNIDTAPLVRILKLRDEPKEMLEIEVQDLFVAYLDRLDHIIAVVNEL